MQRCVRFFRTLLACGADRLLKNKLGNTPLHYAAGRGHVHTVTVLLTHSLPQHLPQRPSSSAPAGDSTEGLGNNGANNSAPSGRALQLQLVNARNRSGITPLHYAVWSRQVTTAMTAVEPRDDFETLNRPCQRKKTSASHVLYACGTFRAACLHRTVPDEWADRQSNPLHLANSQHNKRQQ